LVNFVVTVTASSLVLALAADVTIQLTLFVDWPTSLRAWAITTFISVGVALPISRSLGKAHLELYQAKLQAEALSLADPLTGLRNRRALMEAAAVAAPDPLALTIFDIARFKRVNDTFGHVVGDVVLRSIGQMMAAELGPLGCVARVGGEEFALLSSGVSLESLAAQLTAFCQRVGSAPVPANGVSVPVTISAGAALSEPGRTFEELYSEADRALYAAKLSGRNQVQFAPALDALRKTIAAKAQERKRDPLARSA
jgi:diguanylate cyclase (GGDEF)-like protein